MAISNTVNLSQAFPSTYKPPALVPYKFGAKPTVAPAAKAPASPGAYHGVAITPGSDANIQSQIRAIDSRSSPVASSATLPAASSGYTATPPAPTSGRGLFPSVASSLAGLGTSQPAGNQALIDQITGSANAAKQIGDRAAAIALPFSNEINRVGKLGAGAVAGDLSTGSDVVGSGNAAIASQSASSRINALQQAENAALQGNAQQLAGTAQQTTGLNTALTGTQNTRTLQQNALNSAGQLTQPQVAQYGQTSFSPTTSEFAGSGDFNSALQQYAQLRATGQEGLIPSSITGNSVLNAQVTAMAQQSNPGYNYNTAQGTASAQQQGANIAGITPQQANQQIYGQALNDYLHLQQSVQNVDQFGTLLTSTMQEGGINPTVSKYANQTIGQIRDQLSSQQQAVFDNTLLTLRSRVSGLLQAGGSEVPSAITADAQKIIDGTLPLKSLTAVLNRIQQEGNTLLTTQAGIVNQARQGTLGGNGGTGNSASSGGLYDF